MPSLTRSLAIKISANDRPPWTALATKHKTLIPYEELCGFIEYDYVVYS